MFIANRAKIRKVKCKSDLILNYAGYYVEACSVLHLAKWLLGVGKAQYAEQAAFIILAASAYMYARLRSVCT